MQLASVLIHTKEQTFWRRYGHLGDAYMKVRRMAENAALALAIQCEDEAHEKFVTSVPAKHSIGAKFVAVGMYHVRFGVQFFVMDYETPDDRKDVDEYLKGLQ